ncbi:MAG: hypothetical protein WC472_04250 [Candidatus Paceibacterota bacterium]
MNNTNNNVFEQRTIKNISTLKSGDKFSGVVKIMRRAQPGPVIFTVSDGYGMADAVIKDSSFDLNDVVEISGFVNERAGKIQIEIERIKESKADFDLIIKKNSEPQNTSFSIDSERLEKLRPYFYNISKRIREAVLENQPIAIRHHSDSDGINAGLAIEHSCRLLMEKIGSNPDYNLLRSPSRAPYYDITDAFRDVILIKKLIEGHGQKKPLIVVLDNGSTPEDIFGLKTMKSLGFEIIVIDHHNPVVIKDKKTLVDPYLSLHLNPYIEGLDSQTCAGMLAYELARWICEDYSNPCLPAIAGITDRSNVEITNQYIIKSGRSREELEQIGIAIDFISYQLKFNSGKGLYEELYDNFELVKIINEEVRKGVKTQLESTLPYLRTQNIEGVYLSTIDLEKYTMKFKYPTPGKVVGMIHDVAVIDRESSPVITIGYLSDMIIVRANKPVLPVDNIITRLKKDLPNSQVEGGGHECAGAIKFIPAHLNDIIENIKNQINELDFEKKENI